MSEKCYSVTVGHKTTLQTNIQLAFVLVTFVLYAKSLVHGLLVNILENNRNKLRLH